MKRWIRNTAFKITSTLFLILFLCATLTGSVSILAMMDTGIYTQSKGSLKAEFINRQMQNDLYTIMDAFLYNYGHEFKDTDAHNLRYTITDMTLVLENTYDGEYHQRKLKL